MALLYNFKNSEGIVMTLGEVERHLCELQGIMVDPLRDCDLFKILQSYALFTNTVNFEVSGDTLKAFVNRDYEGNPELLQVMGNVLFVDLELTVW